ncbi:MAG: hypothetical protein LIO44_05055 [Eubacterium sp.]|nr:hypothetical protein [Eubacterium sp.]
MVLLIYSSKYNFSELHPVLAISNKFLQDDTYGFSSAYTSGGNGLKYAMYTTRAADNNNNIFSGPVSDSDMPYTTDSSEIALIDSEDMSIEPAEYFPGTFSRLTFSGALSDEEISARNDILKEMVDSYGSVSVSIYCGELTGSNYENFKQTDDYTLFCYTKTTSSDHAVTIVGYDDSFDVDIFGDAGFTTPSMDGAFIVKNSWGTEWGNNGGFFYMSYASYLDTVCAYGNLMSRDSYDYEYDYTPYLPTGSVGVNSGVFANKFEKQTEAGEEINKIFVYVRSPKTTLRLYVDTTSSAQTTEDFQLVSVESGSGYELSENNTCINVTYTGNYVFELSEPIEVDGDFTIAVYAESEYGCPVSGENTSSSLKVNHKFVNNSYFANDTQSSIYNLYDDLGIQANFMIRAYTKELPVYIVVDDVAYSAAYGTTLVDALTDCNNAAAQGELFEAAENQGNTYRPVDKNMALTAEKTYVYTGDYICTPAIKMEKYQTNETDSEIRFVGEITDSFYDNVAEVTDLGFYYSDDGGSINNTSAGSDLYKELAGDYIADDGTYLFVSEPLPEGNYTVYAYVKYRIDGYDETYTVYTSEQTITAE